MQKLLSTLVFGHTQHRWNVAGAPSDRGLRYLNGLAEQLFGDIDLTGAKFIDEYELPRRHDDEHAGWPDQAVRCPDRLLMIELKTEKRSHRPGQLGRYLDLAVHHHPGCAVDLVYLTPTMSVAPPEAVPDGARYAHVSWAKVTPLIAEVWGNSPEVWEQHVAERLAWWLDEVESQRPAPARMGSPQPPVVDMPVESAVDTVLHQALEVQRDGQQAAVDLWPGSPDMLEDLRLQVRSNLADGVLLQGVPIRNVLPWLWSAGGSGGQALTDAGRTHGYELRLSRYAKDLW